MQRKIGLCGVLVLLALLRFTQAGAVQAVASHAVFYKPLTGGNDSAVIEIYWQINPASLHYIRVNGDSVAASVRTELSITGDNGHTIGAKKYNLTTGTMPIAQAGQQTLLEGAAFTVPKGSYRITLHLTDPQNPRADFAYSDSVTAGPAASPFYSSLQLLDTVFTNNSPSPFLKSGRQQFPNTSGFLDEGRSTLYSYFELYHTDALPAKAFPLMQQTYLTLKKGEIPLPRFLQGDTIRNSSAKQTFQHSFNTETLPSGNYYLCTRLNDKDGNLLASARTFYQSINKNPKQDGATEAGSDTGKGPVEQVSVLDLRKTFIAKYTPAQLRAMLKMISPVAERDERNAIQAFLKKPDEMYIRYFLYNFFLKRNAKDAGAAWKAYGDTVRQANRQFGAGNTPGYETDRGSIFMRYGTPVERIPVPSENGALPYELWTYNDIGSRNDLAVFLFYQPGFAAGDMILLHSTVPGEVRNAAWRNTLYRATGATGNTTSRAEQYIGSR